MLCLAAMGGSLAAPARGESPITLRHVTPTTGIEFTHNDGSTGKRYIVEYVASGLATFDYDGDGLADIYFLNGFPLGGEESPDPPTSALYRNQGDFQFVDVTRRAGVEAPGFGVGVAVADYDNDGHLDIYVSNFGPNVLYRNNGDGTFSDVTDEAGVGRGDKVGAGVAFLDMDGDGDLDLYVSNYVKFTYAQNPNRSFMGTPVYPSPLDFEPEPDNLFRNNGDGTFTDVSRSSGIAARAGTGMGIIAADYDGDGCTDIFVANDVMPNFLWQGDGEGRFREVGLLAGVSFNSVGVPHGNMGVECGDYDNDGQLDFFVTAYQREMATLYRNLGDGHFIDVTARAGSGAGSYNHVKWGCGIVDFDNDGWRDLFVVCGHLADLIERIDNTTSYAARPVLLRNTGQGTFVDVSQSGGDGLQVRSVGRGAAFEDLDNDGRVDVVILNSRRPPTVMRNESMTGNHWLQVQLRGRTTNRDGVGARVKVVAGDLVQVDEVHSGRSYQSHYGMRLSFGLGKREHVDRIEVRWIGGGVDVVEHVPADQCVTIIETARDN
jgi:enediyne biosynthesis protein E4